MSSSATPLMSDQPDITESVKLLSRMSERYQETCAWYRKWVLENPEVVSQVEKTFRVFSYCMAGLTDSSQTLSEFVYALANLLVFFNDNILRKASVNLRPKISLSEHRLQRWLTVLDHVEVFFELASKQVWGEPGRWLVIAGIQILRAIFRLLLLCRYKSGLLASPPIPPLDRKSVVPMDPSSASLLSASPADPTEEERNPHNPVGPLRPQPLTFEGRRSGRVVRSLHATPEEGLRSWRLPQPDGGGEEEDQGVTELAGFSLGAELLYISRPLLHLSCLFVFGWSSWKPWLLSIAADIASLEMMKRDDKAKFTTREREELKNRKLLLLYYLLRSPCYNTFTEKRLQWLLKSTGRTVPCARILTNPLMDYLPVWQKIYSYNWGH